MGTKFSKYLLLVHEIAKSDSEHNTTQNHMLNEIVLELGVWVVAMLVKDLFLDFRYQHDGAPPHYTLAVRVFLDNAFQGRVVGRGAGTFPFRGQEWPPRSPDLTVMDFWLMKIKIYLKILYCPLGH